MMSASVGSTQLQNGHWKSLKITTVTGASSGPLDGSAAVTGILKRSGPSFSSAPLTLSSLAAAPCSALESEPGDEVMLPITMPAKNANNIDTSAEPLLIGISPE